MKPAFLKSCLILFVTFLSLGGCALFPDVDEKCLKNNWETAEEPILYIRLTTMVTTFQNDVTTYNMSQASSITLTGYIIKYYCSGEASGSFDFNTTLLPNNGSIPLNLVKIGGPYQFKFQNDEDRVEVFCRLRASFADGNVFETKDIWDQYSFADIKYDVNAIEKYVLMTIPAGTTLTKVTK